MKQVWHQLKNISLLLTCTLAIILVSCSDSIPEYSGDRALQLLEQQCSFGPRNPGSEGIILCRDFIKSQLIKNGAQIEEQIFESKINGKTYNGVNIIAHFYPRMGRRILFGAHYDTRPWADKETDISLHTQPIMGANDAASGVALLLELSSVLAKHQPSQFGVDMVFFDLEDMGDYGNNATWAIGSTYFANNYKYKDYEKAIVVDMIGDSNLSIEIEYFSYHNSPQLLNEVWEIAKEEGIQEFKHTISNAIYDDHYPLIAAGYNAIDIIDFDYQYWHTLDDTPDKCSAISLQKVGHVITKLIYREK